MNGTFFDIFEKIGAHFISISENRDGKKKTNFSAFLTLKTAQRIDEILRAKACKSCRSRQGLSNVYFLAKFVVDTF